MKKLVLHIYDWLSSHKSVAVAIVLFLSALSLVSALRLHLQEDISAFLPKEQRESLEKAKGQERFAVFFTGGSLDDKLDAMYAFQDNWNAACPDIPIEASADNQDVQEVFQFVSSNWPYFLNEGDYARMDSLLAQPGYIPARLSQIKEALYTGNSIQTRWFRSDPLNLFSPVLMRLQQARGDSKIEEGCLFTSDSNTGIIFFDSPYGGSESANNSALVSALKDVKEATAADFPSVTITSTGGPEVAAENASRIKKDSLFALIVAALLIGLILWLSYKRIADVLWIFISIAAGALFALGLIACFKTSVSLIVLGIGCSVIGIAVNYPLHYVDHLKYQQDKRKALAEQVNPLLVGNITTVGAFLGLLLLKADALHDFGFIGAMMLVGTIAFVLFFLPVFVPAAKGPRKVLKLDLDRFIRTTPTFRSCFFLTFLLLTVFFMIGGKRVSFDSNLHNINYMTKEQEAGFAILESMRADASAFPLPSEEEQKQRLQQWTEFWSSHSGVKAELAQAALDKGFTANSFQPFYDVLEAEWQPVPHTYFAAVDFAPERGTSDVLVEALSSDFDTIGLLCSIIVFVFLWLSFGSLELSLISFLPLAVSWIWIQGIMGWTGLQFNIVNIILATFIFGMGDDYSIFITEGLLYERATGKKILHSYKNAVMLSAIIMFIGIGVLVFARHPAMRSLGLVTILGMATVVMMAYYLPPIVFRWLTTKHGKARKAPITLGSGLRTVYISLMMGLFMTLLSLLSLFIPKGAAFNRIIHTVASWAIRLVPGCKYTLHNPNGEDFSKPAVYICNHQSHLDVLALLALHPKLIFMTNDWVWKFPLYGAVIRKAGFFPASMGLSECHAHVKKMIKQGYSLAIFPEGTRSLDGKIQRFHRGAFLTARELGLDVLPLCIHGFNYALPKHDFLLRRAGLSMEVGKRITLDQSADIAAVTKQIRHHYVDWYASIRNERENAAYCAPLVRLRYLYRGHDALLECRRFLKPSVYEQIDALQGDEIVIGNAGCGVFALLAALTHPDMQITAYEENEDLYLTAIHQELRPNNLKFVNAPAPDSAGPKPIVL